MTRLHVIGVDPGPVPGIVDLRFTDVGTTLCRLRRVEIVQCTPSLASRVIELLMAPDDCPTLVQVEAFVVGRRAGRSSTASAGAATRDLVGAILERWPFTIRRTAANVKPWATDRRLQAMAAPVSGGGEQTLWTATAGMRHSRDAARHALFAACHDGGIPDPLSRRSRHG